MNNHNIAKNTQGGLVGALSPLQGTGNYSISRLNGIPTPNSKLPPRGHSINLNVSNYCQSILNNTVF